MKSAATANTQAQTLALCGWSIVQVLGLDAETSLVLVNSIWGEAPGVRLVCKSELLPLKAVEPASVRVILGSEIVEAQVVAVSSYDHNGNRWAVAVDEEGYGIVAHFSRVLVG